MSDTPQSRGWWLANDGKWYPPGPGWWQASDGNWYPPEQAPGPQPPVPKRNYNRIAVLAVLGLIGAVIGMVVVGAVLDGDHGSDGSAVSICHQFVEDRLKAPATAGFESVSEEDTTQTSDTEWIVRGHVDSENGFGANIRTEYVCTVRYNGDDNWHLVDLQTS